MIGPTRLAALVAVALAPAFVIAQEDEPVELTPPGKWVLGSSFGAGTASGGYGEFLEKLTSGTHASGSSVPSGRPLESDR